MVKFLDGIRSFVSELSNERSPEVSNYVDTVRLSISDMRAIYRTGLGNKIIRIKAGDALKDTLQFESAEDEDFYKVRLAAKVKEAARWCLAFGRGIIVIHHRGDDLVEPLGKVDPARVLLSVFSGDMVVASKIDLDLQSPTYYHPLEYTTRGQPIHHTRVIDFTYVRPPELELPGYRYGGISEFELIYEQIIADGVVQRACPRIIDKASTLFYKVPGFADAMQSGNSSAMVAYFRQLENIRGIMSAGLVDKDDDIEAISQSITNLADADQITLRRLAMVTGISVTRLIGEAPRGMNSTGDKEAQMDQDMLETLQSDYFLEPINELMHKMGQGVVSFKDNQGQTPNDRLDYETKAIDNAIKLAQLGEDHTAYLTDHGVVTVDEYDTMFSEATLWAAEPTESTESTESTEPVDPDAADPTAALNGAQVTSLLDIFEQVRVGTISKTTAARLIALAFPVSEDEGARLVSDIEVSPTPPPPTMEGADEAPWEEEKHPRDPEGKFGQGGGGPSAGKKSEADVKAFEAAKSDGVAIPPAWTGVTYHGKEGKDGIIAQGTDAKGRRQRMEVPAYREGLIREKHARIAKNLTPKMPAITEHLRESVAKGGTEEEKVLYLITQTGFRIGGKGDSKAAKEAFGASTLRGEHVRIDGDTVSFDFPGKKGVRQQHTVKDPVLAKALAGAKDGEPVFKTSDAKVRDAWKKLGGEKVHDIRSHVATQEAEKAIASLVPPKPADRKAYVALQKQVATIAARKLGNRPQESLKTYINHDVFNEVRP